MEQHYQALADQITPLCPPDFEKAELSFELDDGASSFSLRCVDRSGGEHRPRLGGMVASNIDDALDAIVSAWPGPKFSSGQFQLLGDGTFDLKAGYD